ncbi:MAG: putative DNA-binding protein (MmcQ/YjbR family) [Nonlabens sp.]|jgi:predicted DNA-binding protein (MmcQ/YjbR family)|uniref:MmcQ/YjbR family DNA-binding protein n=1 Tax=Nonlabens sp. TaxID=1888209 RepID=UPI0039E47B70
MQIDEIREYCLAKQGVTEEFPFDKVTLVFKVMNKIFCLAALEKWERGEKTINLKCDPRKAVGLREKYDGTVIGGFHSNKKHWNTVYTDRNLPRKELLHLINHSYDLVVAQLTNKDKELLKSL